MIASVAATLPRNPEVAERLELLADVLELEGEESFRLIAYRRAAQRIRETRGSVAQLALDGKAKELPGIGKTIEEKIVELIGTERLRRSRSGSSSCPRSSCSCAFPGSGRRPRARIWHELGVTTLAELKEAAEAQRLRTLPGSAPRARRRS